MKPAKTAPRLTRIMLVDDHFMARIGLALPINQQADMQVIAEACNGQEALELYRQHLPDVVIMDYALPDKNGPEIVTAIRTEFPGARVLLLSAHEGEEADRERPSRDPRDQRPGKYRPGNAVAFSQP